MIAPFRRFCERGVALLLASIHLHLPGSIVMDLPRRQFFHLAAGAFAAPAIAVADAYPSRPVRLLVGFTPAGGNDIIARLMGQWLTERLGQTFVIENRPGAGTNSRRRW